MLLGWIRDSSRYSLFKLWRFKHFFHRDHCLIFLDFLLYYKRHLISVYQAKTVKKLFLLLCRLSYFFSPFLDIIILIIVVFVLFIYFCSISYTFVYFEVEYRFTLCPYRIRNRWFFHHFNLWWWNVIRCFNLKPHLTETGKRCICQTQFILFCFGLQWTTSGLSLFLIIINFVIVIWFLKRV